MRTVILVTYDISDPKRLRRVFKSLRNHGEHLQFSVFRCELNPIELIRLRDELRDIIHHRDDQVLFIQLGPVGPTTDERFSALGRPLSPPSRQAVIL